MSSAVSKMAVYFARGVKKGVVACTVKEGALNVVKVIHEGLGIRHGAITTVHDATNTQMLVLLPVRSYLILAYSDGDEVAMNVGF